ncbi:hypothetical protein SAMN04487866_10814 [Thermoactinomyces sp. DSM 45891]|uniref:hypothetical protein n=1 Tax=Thermoactinomyces sp. DSM 45891 TaxID=1761907 RepID=UPI00090F45C1|nr:hypothetical protein [Thermoactinomyces sp. DSM 45891]SFX44295.1 hypothetical protein SAMN04487866_10814 [Thermoactinomyces sp. DSM 45891]
MRTIAEQGPSKRMNKQEMLEYMEQLEKRVGLVQSEIARLNHSHEKMKQDLRFLELMLLEEYHMLLQIMDRKQGTLRIHAK